MTPAEIKEHRKQLGYTQLKLADKIGVNIGTVGKWEQGAHEISRINKIRLHQVFGIPLEEKRVSKSEEQREFERKMRVAVLHRLDRKTDGKWALLADDDADLELYREMVGAK